MKPNYWFAKSLQEHEDEKAITYLTTFSKLIRTILQNANKREVTLFDEIETCRLYTQLESMRFGEKINCHFHIDSNADLKSVSKQTSLTLAE